MDFARQQRDPTRHVIGIAFVVLVHVLVIWLLMTGLARKAVEVIKKPLNATIIEEVKLPPPPPPPPKKIVEAPKVQQPVQTYVPPPDIPTPQVTEAPVITAVTPTPPAEPHVIAPPPVVVAPPAPAPKPEVRRGAQLVIVSREDPTYPREALKAGIEKGSVTARIYIDEQGNVTEVRIMSAEPPRVFDREVRRALALWKFQPEGTKYIGEVEISFSTQ
jgi:protein TonB